MSQSLINFESFNIALSFSNKTIDCICVIEPFVQMISTKKRKKIHSGMKHHCYVFLRDT